MHEVDEMDGAHVTLSFQDRDGSASNSYRNRMFCFTGIGLLFTFCSAILVGCGVHFDLGLAFVIVFGLVTFFGFCWSVLFMLLAFCVHHNGRGQPQCIFPQYQWVLNYIPSGLIAGGTSGTVQFQKHGSPRHSTLAVEEEPGLELGNLPRAEGPAVRQRLNPGSPDHPIEVDVQAQFEGLESSQALPLSSDDGASLFSSPVAMQGSLPTDSIEQPKQTSTPDELSEMEIQSLDDVSSFISEEVLGEDDTTATREGGRTLESGPTTSVAAQNVTVYEHPAAILLPGEAKEVYAHVRLEDLESTQAKPLSSDDGASLLSAIAMQGSLPTDSIEQPKQTSTPDEVSEMGTESLEDVSSFSSEEVLGEDDTTTAREGGRILERGPTTSTTTQHVTVYENPAVFLQPGEGEEAESRSNRGLPRNPEVIEEESMNPTSEEELEII